MENLVHSRSFSFNVTSLLLSGSPRSLYPLLSALAVYITGFFYGSEVVVMVVGVGVTSGGK